MLSGEVEPFMIIVPASSPEKSTEPDRKVHKEQELNKDDQRSQRMSKDMVYMNHSMQSFSERISAQVFFEAQRYLTLKQTIGT